MKEYPSKSEWIELLKRPLINTKDLEKIVSEIAEDVRKRGDKALIEYANKFENLDLKELKVAREEFNSAEYLISEELKQSIELALKNIELFHYSQSEEIKIIETTKGVKCWRRSAPIQKVGLYIPGGTAPLFSTVLMLGIPAKIAGCREIVICTPAQSDNTIHPAILYTANLIGIKNIYKVGGAQAIAAMAYGTESIPKVYKIFGPGNQYVTAAKQLVNRDGTAIDMPAGPSEVAIIADHTCNVDFVAAEILSQAEHGNDSQCILVTNERSVIEQVMKAINIQIESLTRKQFVLKGLENSKFILTHSIDEAIEIINEYAPEHLVLQIENYEEQAFKIENAGSVFLGNYTPVAAGDYGSGTNHTLPTNGHAKAYSGVSLDSFMKKITFQHITKEGINNIGEAIKSMADAEGLTAHSNSISLRQSK